MAAVTEVTAVHAFKGALESLVPARPLWAEPLSGRSSRRLHDETILTEFGVETRVEKEGFVITNLFRVIDAAIQGNVDCED